jgi:hypothetical protein
MSIITNEIKFNNYKRAFYFGCSFTKYYWPTWADLIRLEIPDSYQYAQVGGGNFYIYQSIIEAVIKHNIQKDDLVMVMFSNVTREDRYTKSEGWITPGNLFYQDTYDEKFMKKFFCEKGYLMRDLNLIEGIDRVLATTGADYSLMTMINFDSYNSGQEKMSGVEDVLEFYKPTLNKIKPSVFEVIFNNDWNTRKDRPKYHTHWATDLYTDNHPTTLEHLEYMQKMFPNTQFSELIIQKASLWTNMTLACTTYQEIKDTFANIIKNQEQRL